MNSASAIDLVDADPTITNDLVPGLCDVGVTKTVTFTATDDFINSSMASSTITVVDTTAPEAAAAMVPVGELEDDEGRFRVEFSCSDGCDDDPQPTGVIAIPSLVGLDIKLKTKSKIKVAFDLEDGKVKIEGPDPQAILDQINNLGGLVVNKGQLVNVELDDDDAEEITFKFNKKGILTIEGSLAELMVACTDSSGNVGTASATSELLAGDDEEDDEDD